MSRVSILIITMNELAPLKALLANLKEQDYQDYEVIVCDNGSTDGTAQYCTALELKYMNTGRNLGTAAFNHALPMATGEYLFFMATDMRIKNGSLARLVKELDHDKQCAQVVPVIYSMGDHSTLVATNSWLSRGFYAGITAGPMPSVVRAPYYGTGLIRKSVIEKIGGYLYDPDFFLYGEDVDLGLRLGLTGNTIKVLGDAEVSHAGSQSNKLFEQWYLTFLVERNMLTAMFKNLEARTLLVSLPYAVLLRGLVFFKDLVKLDWFRAVGRVMAWAWLGLNAPTILAKRKQLQALRKKPDSFFSHLLTEKYVKQIFLNMLPNPLD